MLQKMTHPNFQLMTIFSKNVLNYHYFNNICLRLINIAPLTKRQINFKMIDEMCIHSITNT